MVPNCHATYRSLILLLLWCGSILAQTVSTTLTIQPFAPPGSNPGELRFLEKRANGSDYVGFRAPASIASTLVWTLPAVDATGPLCSDGSGTLSINTCGGAGLPVSDITNIIYNDSDNTKIMKFDASLISTATTRTIQIPNANFRIAGTNIVGQSFSVAQNITATSTGGEILILQNNDANGISGLSLFNNSGTTQAILGWANASYSPYSAAADTLFIATTGGKHISLWTNGTERILFRADGVTLVGLATTDISALPGAIITNDAYIVTTGSSNASVGSLKADSFFGTVDLQSGRTGSGTFLPIAFWTSNIDQWHVGTNGEFIPQVSNDIGTTGSRVGTLYTTNLDCSGSCPGSPPFDAFNPILFDHTDNTKLLSFDLSNITTGVTRTLKAQNASYTLAGINITNTFSIYQFVHNSFFGGASIGLENIEADGYSGIDLFDSGDTHRATIAWANSTTTVYGTSPRNSLLITTGGSDPIVFGTGATEKFRLTSIGGLFGNFNTSSTDISYNPGSILTLGSIILSTATTNASVGSLAVIASNYFAIGSNRSGAGTYLPTVFFTNSTDRGRFTVDGGFYVGLSSTDLSYSAGAIISKDSIISVTASTNASTMSMGAIAGSYGALAVSRTGSGTYLPFTLFTNGTERLRVTTAGIALFGLSSSDASLTAGSIVVADSLVSATSTINASIGSLKAVGGSYFAINSYHTGGGADLPIAFFVAGSEAMRIDTSRNIGIGTSSPARRLELHEPVNVNALFRISTSGSGFSFLEMLAGGVGNSLTVNSSGNLTLDSNGVAAGVLTMIHSGAVANTLVMSSGNTLFGISSTDASLTAGSVVSVASLVSVTASTNASVGSFAAIASNYVAIGSSHTGSGINLPIAFFTASAERLRITATGLILGGLTTTDVSATSGSFITNASSIWVTAATNASVGSIAVIAGNYFAIGSNHSGSGTDLPISFFTASNRRWDITTTGDFLPQSSGIYNAGDNSHRINNTYTVNLNVSSTITSPSGSLGANTGFTCSAGTAIKTISISGGLVTAISCGIP